MSGDPLFEQYGKTFASGSFIFSENEEGDAMYLIRKGKIRITKTFLRGDNLLGEKLEKELVILGKGDFFGEMSLLNQEPRAAAAKALEECELLVINRPTFENMIKTNGHFALKIISKLCERVRNTDYLLEDLILQSKQRKIITRLLELEKEEHEQILFSSLNELAKANPNLAEKDIQLIVQKLESSHLIQTIDDVIQVTEVSNLIHLKEFLES